MKKIIFLLFSILALASCADDLNTRDYESVEESQVFSSASNAQMFVNSLYNDILDDLTNQNVGNDCDDNTANNNQLGSKIAREAITSSTNLYWDRFSNIRACNKAIEGVTNATGMTDTDKNNLLGQAKFLRAAQYYALARKFGRCILIDKVLTTSDDLELPRSTTIKETYDFILKDLDDAATELPATVSQGYVSKGAAYALKAEVCLQGAAYLTSASEKEDYYEQSKTASENLLALGQYSLDNNLNMFTDFSAAQSSSEIILATWKLDSYAYFSDTWMMRLVPNQGGGGKLSDAIKAKWPMESLEGWMNRTPSQDLVNAYEVLDEDGAAKEWDQASYYTNFRSGIDYVGHALYTNRDARFYETIVYDSCKYYNSYLIFRKGGNMWYENNMEGTSMMSKTGYIYKKYVYQQSHLFCDLNSNWCLIHLRLGRSYLNYAEALLRLIGVNKGTATDLKTAIKYINLIRTTHGGLPALDENMTLAETWKRYKRERRLELVLEDDRYWSLLRWSKEEGLSTVPELNDTQPSAIIIAEDGKSFTFKAPIPVVGSYNQWVFSTKRFLLPIPKSEVSTNSKLTNDQNPGWE